MPPRFESLSNLRRLLSTPADDEHQTRQTLELLWALSGQLRNAPLRGIRLRNADLRKIDLRGAILTGSHLSYVDLRGADLRGTDLRRARLYNVRLADAQLAGARLQGARFTHVDLQYAVLGTQPALSLLGSRDCYVCGSDGDAPCVDLETGRWMPLHHPQRWTPHQINNLKGKFSCNSCGGLWSEESLPRLDVLGRRALCPNVPLFFSWATVPEWLAARPRLKQLGIPEDDRVDAFMERRGGRVPLFDLQRLVG